ncbi:hypothetical protein LVJ94_31050 [Pendulispora rubella]|uniref:Glycoside hydrolase family 42 N-terminal domain-containing protein n=1 Tax=Pendulispora rubella TaxID=2741070 RepID=A0ABZ2KRQ8_9BACT
MQTAPVQTPIRGTRSAWVRTVSTGCDAADLELVLPFYEGLRLKPATAALRAAKSEHLELAYPGPLSMPMVAWRCGEGAWTAVVPTKPTETPAGLLLRTTGDELEVRLECFGSCTFQEVAERGPWSILATKVAEFWHLVAPNPTLASRYDRFHYFVRQWVANNSAPWLRSDWTASALERRMRDEGARTISFAFGLDPNEVDLEGHYFWSDGALAEVEALVRANPAVAQFRWLNLRTYKYAIPNLGIERPPPPEVRAAAKVYSGGLHDFSQYVFKAMEMCLGAEEWQRSRFEEMKKLIDLGFKVIAFDEFPTSPKWGTEACRATNHLHRPNDFGDEWRVALDLVRRLSAYAHEHGILLSSEEPSTMLFPFTSGYMDGTFNEPPDMYEHWQKSKEAERIPLFSTMFGARLTPYTRVGGSPRPPRPWLVQEKMASSVR